MKTPEYHNPQNVPESSLKPGERFLLKNEVGSDEIKSKCDLWLVGSKKWCSLNWDGTVLMSTYKTTLPLPPEYRGTIIIDGHGEYYDSNGRKTLIKSGPEIDTRWPWMEVDRPWKRWDDYGRSYPGSIHPNIIEKYQLKDIDWKTPEKQAEVRRMWAENPAMEREVWLETSSRWTSEPEWLQANSWVTSCFYRPAQKPREKSQEDLCREAYQLFAKTPDSEDNYRTFVAGWNAREASRKGVA